MKSLTNWIRGNQIASLFIVTLVISWGLGFSPGAVYQRGQDLLAPLAFVAACGSALAGILISAVEHDFNRYDQIGHLWLVRETALELLSQRKYGDQVEVKTWGLSAHC